MKISTSIIGSTFAFLLATSCCWLPWLAIALGGAFGLTAFTEKLEAYSGLLMAIGTSFFAYSGYHFWQLKKQQIPSQSIELQSILTCPNCSFQKKETMPTDACQFFYECEKCKIVFKPKTGDCCVYCSYGSIKCPPIQTGRCDC